LIQDSVGKVTEGSKLVDQSGKALQEIVTGVKKVTDVVAEIAASSREQAKLPRTLRARGLVGRARTAYGNVDISQPPPNASIMETLACNRSERMVRAVSSLARRVVCAAITLL
jgi:hypothetical protein